MATKPTPGASDGTYGTELNAHLDVSLASDGKVKTEALQTDATAPSADAALANKKYVDDQITSAISGIDNIFGDSTGDDSESNAFLKAHAYSAPTDGIVTAWATGNGLVCKGYVGATTDPAGAGTEEARVSPEVETLSFTMPVPKGKYWEITTAGTLVGVRWRAIGTLSKPVDQD